MEITGGVAIDPERFADVDIFAHFDRDVFRVLVEQVQDGHERKSRINALRG